MSDARTDHAAEDFLPEDWAATPPVSPGFVDRTVARIAAECFGDDPVLGPGVLAAYAPPEPSADFVDRTMRRLAERPRERDWRSLLARHTTPEPSADFVERTLRALRPRAAAPRLAYRRAAALLLAAAAAAAVWIGLRATGSAPAAEAVRPVRFGALYARFETNRAGELRFAPLDPLSSLTGLHEGD